MVRGSVQVVTEPGFDPPIITGEDIMFGEGFRYNGDRYPAVRKVVLDFPGPNGCPRGSIMGSAHGTGRADTVLANMRVASSTRAPRGCWPTRRSTIRRA